MKRQRTLFTNTATWSLLAALGSVATAGAPEPVRAGTASIAPLATTSGVLRQASVTELGETVRVRLPIAGGDQTLELTRYNPLTAGARVVEINADGVEQPVDLAGLAFYKGTIRGDKDSLAFVSIMDDRVNGFVRSAEGVRVISTGHAEKDTPISYELARDLNLGDGSPFCSTELVTPEFDAFAHSGHTHDSIEPTGDVVPARGVPCRVARIAVETDYEFTQLFGGDTADAAAYAITLLAASSTVYERDVNVRLAIPYVRVFATNNDPYIGSSSTVDFLLEMRDHWNTAMRHVPREAVQGLSGRGLGGGVAYVNALCNSLFGHGVSANLNGTFPMPVLDNQSANWDLMVVSHELGHNFGTGHTHDSNSYDPVIDGCGNGDCALATDSTIMSYCHLCPGGIANMDMRFHPRVQSRILQYLGGAACDLIATGSPTPRDDSFELFRGQAAALDVLSNDEMASCAPAALQILSHDATTPGGASVSVISGGPLVGQQLFYTPAPGFTGTDTINYATSAGAAVATVEVAQLREAVAGGGEPGVDAAYYAIPSIANLPDFDAITPFLEEVIGNVNYPSTTVDFAGSGLSDNVGAVFQTNVTVPQDGFYLLGVESDDGSRLWIGEDLVVDNDGLHGMRDFFNIVPLAAGTHPLRVEFFEAGGGAGLIMRYAGETVTRSVIPPSALTLTTTAPCPADLAEPFGTLNFFDISLYIAAYNAQAPIADLAEPFGTLNFFDISAYIALYNAGCP
ncbi:MAG: M12 family metallo-peptidase [Planctomycetota bacterium]